MPEPIYSYLPNFVSCPDVWFRRLHDDLDWVHRDGAPRREYWTNLDDRPYTYGAGRGVRTYEAQPPHPLLDSGRSILAQHTGATLQGVFLNLYGTSRDWLGWHSDDDPGIDHSKPIAVITVGQGRVIQFRQVIETPSKAHRKGIYGAAVSVMLEHGSLLLMHPGCQFTHQHQIPKAGHHVKPRISLTYRGLMPLKEKDDEKNRNASGTGNSADNVSR